MGSRRNDSWKSPTAIAGNEPEHFRLSSPAIMPAPESSMLDPYLVHVTEPANV